MQKENIHHIRKEKGNNSLKKDFDIPPQEHIKLFLKNV